jgi:hypothetical protein
MKTQTKQEIKDMKIDYFMYGMFTSLCFGVIITILISSFFYNQTYLYREGFEAGKLNVSCEVEPPYESNLNKSKIDVSTLRFNPEISQRPIDKIMAINTEICKPIPCPQDHEYTFTLPFCYNCSEVLEQ